MQIEETVVGLCRDARQAARGLAMASATARNTALTFAAARLRERAAEIQAANREDVAAGKRNGLSSALIDRLSLNDARIEAMAQGLDAIVALPDPLGETIARWRRPNGLEISQVRVPLGVVGVIYESRPNVTADAAGLCLKSGNAVILKGGSEAFATNTAIAACLAEGSAAAGLPRAAAQLIPTTDRRAVAALLAQRELVDVIVPRGGTSLIQAITESSSIPVIQHYAGICHVYVDDAADLDMAERIAVNAKVQRPGVCNAMETLLVHADVADRFLPRVGAALQAASVKKHGSPRTRAVLPDIAVNNEKQ